MQKKYLRKIDGIKLDLEKKFGSEKFEKIYNFYKNEEKVLFFTYNKEIDHLYTLTTKPNQTYG